MRYTPRRHRGDDEHEGGGLPVIPLVVIVVFAGLLLGGLLAHFFGSRTPEQQVASSPSFVTPVPSPTASHYAPLSRRSHLPMLVSSPRPSPRLAASAKPSPKKSPIVTPAPTPNTTVSASATPAQVIYSPAASTPHTVPATTLPAVITASPAPAERTGMQTNDPAEIVRAYLSALERGNTAQATSYLASGLPEEPFMRGAHIGEVETNSNGDGTYLVTAVVHARSGSYRVTCTVAALPQGMVITDHFYVKP